MKILSVIMSNVKKQFGARKFYDLPEELVFPFGTVDTSQSESTNTVKLMRYIDENVIGKNQTFPGPFGKRKVVYCDYTASGRALQFIEDYIMKHVLPMYGNTHTTTTITSMQSTLYRHEARDIMRNAVHASEEDAVLFTGHGCTAAIHKLIHGLNLTKPPVVFVGPWEHHSNLLPWREIGSKIIRISENKDGILDLDELEMQLKLHQELQSHTHLIGCFSAASNITGILADDIATTLLLHQYGALAFWDYATAAPYISIDMNPFIPGICETSANKDAVFFSGHKFVGGVQSPGILIVKKNLFQNPVPEVCGGGTVFYVTRDDHRYLKDPEVREEGGTGAIIESIRAGMAMQLKQSVGSLAIMTREEEIVKMVLAHIRTIPEIILLGTSSPSVKRLAVFSILVRHPRGTFLHHNFVCSILNDMFGIQARGGCACAGPYAQDLLGIDEDLARKYESVLLEDSRLDRHHLRRKGEYSNNEMLRPGFTRISIPYFMSDTEVAFVLEALKMVATEGWKLLPQYSLNAETGEWRHHSNMAFRERKWLGSIRYVDGKMMVNEKKSPYVGPCPLDYNECLRIARNNFNKARKMAQKHPLTDQYNLFDEELNNLRWFMLPSEAQDLLLCHSQNVKQVVPFHPVQDCTTRPQSLKLPPQFSTSDDNKRSKPVILRQRSDSHSCTQQNNCNTLKPEFFMRERCHSLGSALITETQINKIVTANVTRERQISCGSQTDIYDVDSSFSSESDVVKVESPLTPMYLTTNTPELLHAYVKGVTKELATEIKSELRGVIAQVEDVLSESCDSDHNGSLNSLCDKRLNNDNSKNCCSSIVGNPPVHYSCSSPNLHNCDQSIDINHIHCMENALANQLSDYLVGFTSEVVHEMKSELRGVVNAVDDLISPSSVLKSPQYSLDNGKEASAECKSVALEENDSGLFLSITSKSDQTTKENGDVKLSDALSEIFVVQSKGVDLQKNENSCQNTVKSNCDNYNLPEIKLTHCTLHESPKLNCKAIKISSMVDVGIVNEKWHCPPKNIWKPTLQAINEFEMIRDGDSILVCLSGGKDSLSLLHTLRQYQHYAASKGILFKLACATVDPKSSSYDPRPLIPYLKALGLTHHYEEQPILEQASKVGCKSVCSFCSRMKRGRLYSTARKHGYNVLALGQHLDDIAESFFMSTFHNGRLRSMKAHYYVREKDLRVIRPFIYVRERSLRKFAESCCLPVIPENCPACFEAPKERYRMKQLLAQQEILFPKLFLSIRKALKPAISYRYTEQENAAFQGGGFSFEVGDDSSDNE